MKSFFKSVNYFLKVHLNSPILVVIVILYVLLIPLIALLALNPGAKSTTRASSVYCQINNGVYFPDMVPGDPLVISHEGFVGIERVHIVDRLSGTLDYNLEPSTLNKDSRNDIQFENFIIPNYVQPGSYTVFVTTPYPIVDFRCGDIDIHEILSAQCSSSAADPATVGDKIRLTHQGFAAGERVFIADRLSGTVKHDLIPNDTGDSRWRSLILDYEIPQSVTSGGFSVLIRTRFPEIQYDCGDVNVYFPPNNDADGDGVLNADDNCSLVYNPDQKNFDASPIDNGPTVAGDDRTVPNGDILGDVCDDDDDNDGVLDVNDHFGEIPMPDIFVACSGGLQTPYIPMHNAAARGDNTNDDNHNGNPAPPMGTDSADNGPSWDIDNDGQLDGYECNFSDVTKASSKRLSKADDGLDYDSDGLLNGWERAGWGTDPTKADTDGDGLGDCKEAVDTNGDGGLTYPVDAINAAKASQTATFGKTMDYDLNKDGLVLFPTDTIYTVKRVLAAVPCL